MRLHLHIPPMMMLGTGCHGVAMERISAAPPKTGVMVRTPFFFLSFFLSLDYNLTYRSVMTSVFLLIINQQQLYPIFVR